ncbi:MAG: PSD1 and planctomycete cytochrome C domain-containing protein [Verrucomicrobiota bacterium]
MSFRHLLAPVILAASVGAAEPSPTSSAAQLEFFEKEVRPVLAEHCYKCHGEKKQKSGLRLDSREFVLKGGEVGPVVVPGKPETSRLILSINHVKAPDVHAMPGEDEKLPPQAIAALTEWVRQGLPWPQEATPLALAPTKHRAFQPVKAPAAPTLTEADAAKVRQPLDRFVLAKLREAGLDFNPVAPRELIIRRLTLALWGFNPTAAESAAYVGDADPQATEKLVDRLLAAPAFGERWGRHWLDVARYADTKGYVFQEERRYPYAYTYRDWVVKAFNDDLPYDQFLRLQLAADQIVKDSENNRDLAALGFLTLGRRFLNSTPDIIDDRIDVVMRGTQGLTMACSRCHDHKFDPLPTTEYYSLYAIFNSSEEPKELPPLKPVARTKETEEFEVELGVREKNLNDFVQSRYDLSFSPEKTTAYLNLTMESLKDAKLDANQKAKAANLYAAVLGGWKNALKPKLTPSDPAWGAWVSLQGVADAEFPNRFAALLSKPTSFADPLLRARLKAKTPTKLAELTATYAALLSEARQPEHAAYAEWKPWRELILHPSGPTVMTPASLIGTYNVADRNTRNKLQIKVSGFKATNPKSPPHAMALVDKAKAVQGVVFLRGSASRPGKKVPRQYLSILSEGPPKEFTQGSGRLDLANAIASPTNPLTSRVMVNRVWMHLLGQPLVETPSDFGVRTAPGKHPALLDHLANTFVRDGWSMKKLIRSIVLSRTFLQSADLRADAVAKDPDNALYWRAHRRRLDFEAMRDSMLRVAGRLEDAKLGGQPFDLVGAFGTPRRTIYGHLDRQNLPAFFRTFDFANPDYHVPKRNQTTTPQQSLWMLNHPFGRSVADELSAKAATQPDDAAKVRALYLDILARAPRADETALALEYLREASQAPAPAAWTNGFGAYDPKTKQVTFTEMTARTKDRISPTDKLPDKKYSFVFLSAKGGHPGEKPELAAIRRWTAGSPGKYRIEGDLLVGSKASDGVRARVCSVRSGLLKEVVVAGGATGAVTLAEVELAAGESLDFIADNFRNSNSDGFTWSPVIKDAQTGEVISSAANEFGRKPDRQSALSTFAQVLLQSNEFNFAD